MKQHPLLTIKELAQYLKVSPKTLYKWSKSGKIPSLKINGVVRFSVTDIHDFLSSHKVEPPDPVTDLKIMLGLPHRVRHNRHDSGKETS